MKINKLLCSLLLTSMFASNATYANDVLGNLSSVFFSNTTSASGLSTNDRVGFTGGGASIRTPIVTANLISFDMPRANAGCGGLDLYGGSFSFINGQALVTLMKAVATNSVGLAFKIGIQTIFPQLSHLISEFQAIIQDLNKLAKNSCNLAHMIVDPAAQALGLNVNGDGAVNSSNQGIFGDTFSALDGPNGYLQQADAYLKKAASFNQFSGNNVWKGVVASGAGSMLGAVGLPSDMQDSSNPNTPNNRLLVSVTGFSVAGLACGGQNNGVSTTSTGSINSTGQPGPPDSTKSSCRFKPTITLSDLVAGGGMDPVTGMDTGNAPLKMYTCVNTAGDTSQPGPDAQICSTVSSDDFAYAGINGFINTQLFGSPAEPADASGITSDSILGIILGGGKTVQKLSATQIAFIKGSPLPLMAYLENPAAAGANAKVQVARKLRRPIADCLAASIGQAIYKAALTAQTNNSYDFSETKEPLAQLRRDYEKKIDQCTSSQEQQNLITWLKNSTDLSSVTNK